MLSILLQAAGAVLGLVIPTLELINIGYHNLTFEHKLATRIPRSFGSVPSLREPPTPLPRPKA